MKTGASIFGRMLFLSILITLIASACGSASGTTSPQTAVSGTPNNTSAAPTSASVQATSSVPTSTMFEYFVTTGNLTVLADAIKTTNLPADLQGKGPYTAFAPTDQAFSVWTSSQLDALFSDKAKLKELLLYHLVQGEYSASELLPLTSLTTLQGGSLQIKPTNNNKVTINGANIIIENVPATDGIIHLVDRVLVPPGMTIP